MKEHLINIIKRNPDSKFVVVINNSQEADILVEVADAHGFECPAPVTNRELVDNAFEEYGYPFGIRLKCYNGEISFADVEHWKFFETSIYEFTDGDFRLIDR